jgi:hypothetical protein
MIGCSTEETKFCFCSGTKFLYHNQLAEIKGKQSLTQYKEKTKTKT